jgi:hypothetical protein
MWKQNLGYNIESIFFFLVMLKTLPITRTKGYLTNSVFVRERVWCVCVCVVNDDVFIYDYN